MKKIRKVTYIGKSQRILSIQSRLKDVSRSQFVLLPLKLLKFYNYTLYYVYYYYHHYYYYYYHY
jgi:hypothetical protein